jgi:Rrf2 family protein
MSPQPSRSLVVELPAKVEYALLALLEIASRSNRKEPLKICEITAKQPIPERYLEQILTSLRHSGIVQSQRGARGGYILTREPWQITLLDIIASVEGEQREQEKGASPTVERSLINEVWQQAKTASQSILGQYTLEDLRQRREVRLQSQPMYHI